MCFFPFHCLFIRAPGEVGGLHLGRHCPDVNNSHLPPLPVPCQSLKPGKSREATWHSWLETERDTIVTVHWVLFKDGTCNVCRFCLKIVCSHPQPLLDLSRACLVSFAIYSLVLAQVGAHSQAAGEASVPGRCPYSPTEVWRGLK